LTRPITVTQKFLDVSLDVYVDAFVAEKIAIKREQNSGSKAQQNREENGSGMQRSRK
jgi:hypothetical protein